MLFFESLMELRALTRENIRTLAIETFYVHIVRIV